MRGITPVFLMLVIPLSTACTTFQPTEASPDQIQRLILSGELLEPGDRVKLVTTDESVRVHDFRIVEVDLDVGVVIGRDDVVRIPEIVALETRKLSWLRTGLLIGGLVLAIQGPECSDNCGGYSGFPCCP